MDNGRAGEHPFGDGFKDPATAGLRDAGPIVFN
jgi:hypothetical protein